MQVLTLARIILVRHGETDSNRERRFRGHLTMPLNSRGIKQAQAARDTIKSFPINAVYCSPTKRTRMTAEIIAEPFSLPITELKDLIDQGVGDWEGRLAYEVEAENPEIYRRWLETPHLVTAPGGESLEQVKVRAARALEYVVHHHPQDSVVIVSHKTPCKAIIGEVLGLDTSRYWNCQQDLACINILNISEKRPVVERMNDTCHLQGIDG